MTDLHTYDVGSEVMKERQRQDKKWGAQNHPDGTGGLHFGVHIQGNESMTELAEFFTERTDDYFKDGIGSWWDILLEEVFEAGAEADTGRLRAELIQVAAVAIAWCEAIDRRNDD